MLLKLFHSTKQAPLDIPANKEFRDVANILLLLKNRGISNEIIDTSSLSEEGIQKAYSDAVVPSVFKKFGIRRVFGSRRRSGNLFGRGVPALLVYDEGDQHPSDVYPRDEGQGKVRTIREFLYDLQTILMVGSGTANKPRPHTAR